MRWASSALWTAALLVLAVPSVAAFSLFPDAKSQVQRDWQDLFTTIFWAALIVFVLVEGLLLYALVRFRRRKEGPQEGPHIHGNTRLEVAWTIAPTLVMAWLLVVSLRGLDRVDNGPTPDFEVDVIARQFYWSFAYPPNYDREFRDTLYVEEGQVVGLRVTAYDVIHAFNVPELGVMIDAVPGKINKFWFRADEPGNYSAQCRELCGVGHARMHGMVVVLPAGTQEKPWGPPELWAPANATAPANETQQGNATTPAADVTQSVVLDEFKIDPKEFTAQPGQSVLLQVDNQGGLAHNLYIGMFEPREVKWNTEDMQGGQKADLLVELPDEPGVWEWWCDVPGHKDSGMFGSLSTGGTKAPGERPLLPGFEPMALLGALAIALVFLRRR